jgi:predicted nucleic acid-binding protein
MKTVISTKGQIVIPVELRKHDNIQPGQAFEKDSLIAATSLTHGFELATRNRRHFEACGVELVDPFA